MKTVRITLDVPWEDDQHDHPSQWNWTILTDSYHEVEVVSYTEQPE